VLVANGVLHLECLQHPLLKAWVCTLCQCALNLYQHRKFLAVGAAEEELHAAQARVLQAQLLHLVAAAGVAAPGMAAAGMWQCR
jgi:hypothetical protein